MEVYFDNSATTRVYDEAIDIMVKTMKEDYGNPSSLHLKGLDAEHLVKDSTDKICKVLKCLPEEVPLQYGGQAQQPDGCGYGRARWCPFRKRGCGGAGRGR